MERDHHQAVRDLVAATLGAEGAGRILRLLEPMLPGGRAQDAIDRDTFAAAMNVLLFAGLLDRVPMGAAYAADVEAAGQRIRFDHGAIRTVCLRSGETGALPRGELAFRRILEPLGYREAGIYPLPALRMTGQAYRHEAFPESIPQFFVSELHVDRFDDAFSEAAQRVFGASRDPLDQAAAAALRRFGEGGALPPALAIETLRTVVSCFDRQHERPMLSDYEALRRCSAEAAWIATEGNAFNHATDRVDDVEALAQAQKALGRPIKDSIEVGRSGRVRQTAFRADTVERAFGVADGPDCRMAVPGSFYEFISREIDPATGRLDLSFDSANATGIFAMTRPG